MSTNFELINNTISLSNITLTFNSIYSENTMVVNNADFEMQTTMVQNLSSKDYLPTINFSSNNDDLQTIKANTVINIANNVFEAPNIDNQNIISKTKEIISLNNDSSLTTVSSNDVNYIDSSAMITNPMTLDIDNTDNEFTIKTMNNSIVQNTETTLDNNNESLFISIGYGQNDLATSNTNNAAYETYKYILPDNADLITINCNQVTNSWNDEVVTLSDNIFDYKVIDETGIYKFTNQYMITTAREKDNYINILDGSSIISGGNKNDYIRIDGHGMNDISTGTGTNYIDIIDSTYSYIWGGPENDSYAFNGATTGGAFIADAAGENDSIIINNCPYTNIAFFKENDNLVIDYGEKAETAAITILNQDINTIEKIIANNYQCMLTNNDINNVIQEMSNYASSHGIMFTNVRDVKTNPELMNIIANSWNH
ncbi:MAG: hypothetical protein WCK67_10280 [bacterium]